MEETQLKVLSWKTRKKQTVYSALIIDLKYIYLKSLKQENKFVGGVKRYDIIAFNFKPCPNSNASINCLSNWTSKRVPLKYRPGVVEWGGGACHTPYVSQATSTSHYHTSILPVLYLAYLRSTSPIIKTPDMPLHPSFGLHFFVPLKSTPTSNKPLA